MTAILRNESEKLLRGSLILTGVFGLIAAFFLAVFPGFQDEAELIEEAIPGHMAALLGFEELHTIEGFAAGYMYPLLWILLGGIYVAYLSAGMISGDIRNRKMDLTLSNPVSRESVVLQKVTSLWVPLAVLSAGLIAVLFVGALVIGESFDLVPLVMVHVLSIPYLLVCAGIGIVLSVVIDRVETAQVTALGLVFMLWLVDGLSEMESDFERIGEFTPSRYYDPSEILVHEEYAFVDAGILVATFLVLLAIATFIFTRRDI